MGFVLSLWQKNLTCQHREWKPSCIWRRKSYSDTYRQNRQLKALTQKYGEDLKDIGISIEENGSLSMSDNIFKNSSLKEIRKVFSDDSNYVRNVRNIAKRMNSSSYDEVYAMMTGAGGRVNIVL